MMDIGKLPAETLSRLLSKTRAHPDVIIGPAYGEDAAAVRISSKVVAAAADPITFATDRIGYYAVSVNANDIAVLGAVPRYFLATILLPPGSTESHAESVFNQILQSCERIGVELIGGHTEITDAVERTVVSGCMLGEADEGELVRSSGAQIGDAVILAGGISIEGAAILAREAQRELKARGVAETVAARAAGFLDDPGICILDYARAAVDAGPVTSMHDPTEGGLATALYEVASASECGLVIERNAVEILPECDAICQALEIDPFGLIASGSLLVTAPDAAADDILRALQTKNVTAARIGAVVAPDRGVRFDDGSELPVFDRDEIARYFSSLQISKE